MNNPSNIIGHQVITHTGSIVGDEAPCTLAEAYSRISAYITENPTFPVPSIEDVTEPTVSPLQGASQELGGLLEGLLARHGLNLGLSRAQINTQIAKELASLGAIPAQIARLTR